MHLSLSLITQSGKMVQPDKKLSKSAFLAMVNLSRSGWSLRVLLLPQRRWLVSSNLIIEFDPPEKSETDFSEQEFNSHFVYEMLLQKEQEGVQLTLSQGQFKTW